MRSGEKNTKKEQSLSFIPSVWAEAHRFHFHSIFGRLLGGQVKTQHLIGQLTNHSRAEREKGLSQRALIFILRITAKKKHLQNERLEKQVN